MCCDFKVPPLLQLQAITAIVKFHLSQDHYKFRIRANQPTKPSLPSHKPLVRMFCQFHTIIQCKM